ncbi:Beta-galactosidase [Enhygromyxa salina]|uniref:Beta-galactosidase n=1 Tax=Enhygromyxa salina TaxID=215803 RepID=A0A0C1ZAC8_9BACT|nr:hypothetical protein [Enhygromyxa salina]KIG14569.1 Beta-galactosidase [Enhygromyxa salina]
MLTGCAEPDDAVEADIERGLFIDDDGASVSGTFANEDHALRFHGDVFGSGSGFEFEVQIELNGMTISARQDADGNLEYDGRAIGSDDSTQMTEDDRLALAALSKALDELGPKISPPLERIRGFANMWSEFPSSMDLRGQVSASFRSYTSICGAMNTYVEATHDDWSHGRWEDKSTHYAYVSMHGPGPCSDGTYFLKNNSWECYEPDHDATIEYAYGNCFGRCGGGCGSSSQMTYDCLDHDSCVRFGHSIASFWCDDEFSSTIDDWASAPNCQ